LSWWEWALIGLALLGAEVATPGAFFFLFFGLAGLIVAALTATGVTSEAAPQGLLFSIISVVLLALFRRPLVRRIGSTRGIAVGTETLVGEIAILLDDLPAGGVTKGELRGTSWSVRSRATTALGSGARCRVERVDGLTLWVFPEHAEVSS
jgi:membrane protein implicated in regulation of membrane protease activity